MKDAREEQAEKLAQKGLEIQAKLYGIDEELVKPEVPVKLEDSQQTEPTQPEEKSEAQTPEPVETKKSKQKPEEKPKQSEKKTEEETWKQKYDTLTGKYNAEIPKLKTRLDEAEKRATEWKEAVAEIGKYKLTEQPQELPKPAELPGVESITKEPQKYVTQKDVEDYGAEQLQYIQRVAREVVEDMLYNYNKTLGNIFESRLKQFEDKIIPVTNELKTVKTAQTKTTLEIFYDRINELCPEIWKYNKTTEFNEWLDQPSPESGFMRRSLLDDAVSNLDAGRIARLFNAFLGFPKTNNLATNEPVPTVTPIPGSATLSDEYFSERELLNKPVRIPTVAELVSPGESKAGASAIAMVSNEEIQPYSMKRWAAVQAQFNRRGMTLEEFENEKNKLETAAGAGKLVP